MANEQTSVTRVADHGELPLLLDKARQFAGQYIESLEERPVFPSEKSLRAMHPLREPLPEDLVAMGQLIPKFFQRWEIELANLTCERRGHANQDRQYELGDPHGGCLYQSTKQE